MRRCPPATGKVAGVKRGLCACTEKVANVDVAVGYEDVIVMNHEGSDATPQPAPVANRHIR
jgi:hypothetical protein